MAREDFPAGRDSEDRPERKARLDAVRVSERGEPDGVVVYDPDDTDGWLYSLDAVDVADRR